MSRTFALTIPELPAPLAEVVGTAYLLCRIADTLEDDPDLERGLREELVRRFLEDAFRDDVGARGFAARAARALGRSVPEDERRLVAATPAVMVLWRSYGLREREAMQRCVRIMGEGMIRFQGEEGRQGLRDLGALDAYCYHVAGVVGEMLTSLFSAYGGWGAEVEAALMARAVSFGQALQMTNILKDVWEDRARGACWLPRDVFARHGVDLRTLEPGRVPPGWVPAMEELLGVARFHLERAAEYTALLPREQAGMRRFCLWALGMAVLTLRRIDRNPSFREGAQVKISRRAVRATTAVTAALARHDRVLRWLFRMFVRTMPPPPASLDAGAGERSA